MQKRIIVSALIAAMVFGSLSYPSRSFAATPQLVVDLSADMGVISHGATGFLYGLGNEGIPTDNVLAPLKPKGTAQKAPDGLQHPNGDALQIAPEFKRDGGQEVQVYMQDIYQNWPYENLGIADYLSKVDVIIGKVKADPNYSMYVYVPFNEPDGIWYSGMLNYSSSSGASARQKFFSDWLAVFNRIRALDPGTRIVGPNLTHYDAKFYSDFMTFAKANNVLPDMITWHELQNSFFTDYYNNLQRLSQHRKPAGSFRAAHRH